MIAYKGFQTGLICRGYQFVMGLNVTEEANCKTNGFHCAENPLDCLTYYSYPNSSEYYIVGLDGSIIICYGMEPINSHNIMHQWNKQHPDEKQIFFPSHYYFEN